MEETGEKGRQNSKAKGDSTVSKHIKAGSGFSVPRSPFPSLLFFSKGLELPFKEATKNKTKKIRRRIETATINTTTTKKHFGFPFREHLVPKYPA